MSRVIRLIRAGFQDLATASSRLNEDLGVNASMRSVLEALAEDGPSTVPAIAGKKRVSRQFIQQLADALADAGHVEFVENPAHKRSQLVRLTDDGRRVFAAIAEREQVYLEALSAQFSPEELDQVAATLVRLRAGLAKEMNW